MKEYLETKDQIESLSVDELSEQLLSEQKSLEEIRHYKSNRAQNIKATLMERQAYCEMPRLFGAGSVRIGRTIQMGNESIYTLAFLSYIKFEIINREFDIIEGEWHEPKEEEEQAPPTSINQQYDPDSEIDYKEVDMKAQVAIIALRRKHELLRNKRYNIGMHMAMCVVSQMFLVCMVFVELRTNCQYYAEILVPTSPEEVFVFFICIKVLHLSMIDQTQIALGMMKFVCNQPYIFDDSFTAYKAALLMNISTVLIEFANMLVVIMSGDTLSVIGNFVALVIIAEFDTYIYASLKDETLIHLIND